MIPFIDLRAQYRQVEAEVSAAVSSVLASGQYVLGPAVEAFEAAFAAYCGTRHCVAVNSGTSALHLALLAVGVGRSDEVVTVPHTFVATVAAVDYIGARARLVDVDPDRFTMAPALLDKAIGPRTKAIVPVHLYGQPADMEPITAMARRHGVPVVSDAAQAHGARYRGRPLAEWADATCFSFYPAKNLGACGEGGAIATNDDELARKMRCMRDWGQERKNLHTMPGFNYRMDGIQGAVLGVKLRYLAEWTRRRQQLATLYDSLLTERGPALGVLSPPRFGDCEHVYHIYAVRCDERDRLQHRLSQRGIPTGIHYPLAVHLNPAFAHLGYAAGDFPVAESNTARVLSLPLYPEMLDADVRTVAEAVLDEAAALTKESTNLG
jgi:dTDP-4-amino-4,6-dideoxygalactose transaminase